jgi:primary-amine oxidase
MSVQHKLHEAVVNLSTDSVEYNVRLGPNVHGSADGEEIVAVEKVALADPGVQAAIAKLKLPEGAVVVVDPWIYGMLVRWSYARNVLTMPRR